MDNRVLICGLGHVGFRAALLLRRLGSEVTAIYEHTPADWIAQASSLGIVCLSGDARDGALLERAGVRTAQAIIAATDHDMVNLSVAMDARRLNPKIVITIRLFDTSLAPHIETALGIRKALSTSSLAAPVFACAALGHNIAGYFSAGGRAYTISEIAVPADSPWLGLDWDAVSMKEEAFPLFRIDGAAHAVPILAGLPVQAGQRIMLLRQAAQDFSAQPPGIAHSRATASHAWTWRALSLAWQDVPPAIKGVMAALALVIVAGTFTFNHFLHMAPVDAFYFVITTITTTGYGDFNLQGSAPWLKLFGCFVMLCGAALMATVFSVVTDLLLKTRFRRLMETPQEAGEPHAILVGQNNLGQRIAQELRQAGLPVVTLAPPAHDPSAVSDDATSPVIVADPRSETALTRAGIATATAVVAVTEDDIMNLGAALQARKMNPTARSVIRTFDAALGAKLQAQLGGDAVISASAVSAPTFAATAICSDVIQASVWRDHLILVQYNERTACSAPDRPVLDVAFRATAPADNPHAARFALQQVASGSGPELRISAVRLA